MTNVTLTINRVSKKRPTANKLTSLTVADDDVTGDGGDVQRESV